MASIVHYDLEYQGFMGRVMNEVIYPDPNLIDAIWISPAHPDSPVQQGGAHRYPAASTHPVALEWYTAKRVLYPVSGYGRRDPDTAYGENTNPYQEDTRNTGYPYNAFRVMLEHTASVLPAEEHDFTLDPSWMTVHRGNLREGLEWSGGHCVLGADYRPQDWYFAEGTAREGFEEWPCLQNLEDQDVATELTFFSGEGEVIPLSLKLPPHSPQLP